jgi:hypothetical protein
MKKSEIFDYEVRQMTIEQSAQDAATDGANQEFSGSPPANLGQNKRVTYVKHVLLCILVACEFFISSLSCPAKGAQMQQGEATSVVGDPPLPRVGFTELGDPPPPGER